MLLMVLGGLVFVVWVYIMFVRTWALTKWPWLLKVDALWSNSRQVLVGYMASLGGLIVGIHDAIMTSGADASTFLHEVSNFIPEKYRGLAVAGALFGSGVLLTWLRQITTGPVGSSVPGNK